MEIILKLINLNFLSFNFGNPNKASTKKPFSLRQILLKKSQAFNHSNTNPIKNLLCIWNGERFGGADRTVTSPDLEPLRAGERFGGADRTVWRCRSDGVAVQIGPRRRWRFKVSFCETEKKMGEGEGDGGREDWGRGKKNEKDERRERVNEIRVFFIL